MVPASLSDLARRMSHLAAKSGGVPLLDHLLDVCGQARQFLTAYQPHWPDAPHTNLHRILAYASLMHDFGKIHPGFQAALQPAGPRFRNRHEVLSLAFLYMLDIPPAELAWIAAAIATHHRPWAALRNSFGDSVSENTYLGKLCQGVRDNDALLLYELLSHASQIFAALGWGDWERYPLQPYAKPDYRAAILSAMASIEHLLQSMSAPAGVPRRPGVKTPRDWGPVIAGIHVRGWLLSADHLASFRSHPIHVALQNRQDVDRAYPDFCWKPHQLTVANHSGSALLVAPTGSGKTEAGLLWAAKQAEGGATGRLAVVLPYQTSLNAMQRRLVSRLDPPAAKKPERWNFTVGLLHGRASRHLYETFLEHDHAPPEAALHARHQNTVARLFIAPVLVSTVFSVIRLLFATRGPERLFVAFSGARIVVDEIHAYAPEITALSLAALRFLQEHLGARILLMSATVSAHLEAALTQTMNLTRIPPTPAWNDKPRHRLNLLPFDSQSHDALQHIVRAAARGSVLVVVNQVKRAIELWRRLESMVPTQLLHSRFHLKDRARIEQNISPRSGFVLVATQAVEVSLDLDFDSCFTELAPVESIAQRFGRCNRRGAQPGPAPVAVFLAFPQAASPHLPYDKEHIETTRQALQRFCRNGARDLTDADVHELLNDSYSEALKADLERHITDKTRRLQKAFLDNWQPFGQEAANERQALERQWEDLFDGEEVLPESMIPEAEAEGTWFGAARFLVPISSRQFRAFQGDIHWHDTLQCHVIRRPYGATGLDLTRR